MGLKNLPVGGRREIGQLRGRFDDTSVVDCPRWQTEKRGQDLDGADGSFRTETHGQADAPGLAVQSEALDKGADVPGDLLRIRFPGNGEVFCVEEMSDLRFEPVQLGLADSLREKEIIAEPSDQLCEREIMRLEFPYRLDGHPQGRPALIRDMSSFGPASGS